MSLYKKELLLRFTKYTTRCHFLFCTNLDSCKIMQFCLEKNEKNKKNSADCFPNIRADVIFYSLQIWIRVKFS